MNVNEMAASVADGNMYTITHKVVDGKTTRRYTTFVFVEGDNTVTWQDCEGVRDPKPLNFLTFTAFDAIANMARLINNRGAKVTVETPATGYKVI